MATILDNQIGFADETTYGTRVVPTRFLEFTDESFERNQVNRASAGLRKGQKVLRSDKQNQANRGAMGPVGFDIAQTGFGLLLKHIFGAAPVITQPAVGTDPLVYDQTFTLGDAVGLSLTAQVGRPGSATPIVVRPFDYLGCKVKTATFAQGQDAFAHLTMDMDAQSEVDTQTLATASYPAASDLFDDGQLTVSVNSTSFFSKSSSLTIDRQMATDRYGQRGNTLKKEPIPAGLAALTGSLNGEFEDLTTSDLFKNGTIVPITFDWVGPIISTTYTYELKLTLPACRLDGPKPKTSKAGILDAPTPFTVLSNNSAEPITCLYRGTDSAI